MKTFIVLQKIVLFRVDWQSLFNPQSYRLILIVHEPTLAKLSEQQKKCFTEIYCLAQYHQESLQKVIHQIIQSTKNEINIITNDELCIELAAQLREIFNLPGDRVKKIKPFIDKDETKRLLATQAITIPRYIRFDPMQYKESSIKYLQQINHQLGFPIFAKPINSAATQFTNKLNKKLELAQWCEQHAKSDNFELDEFITGKLFHCESIIKDNEILFARAGENAHPCFDFMSGKITGCITLPEQDPLVKQLLAFNEKVLMAMTPLPNCVTHMEIFQRTNGELVFSEVACRAPGGMIVQMHEKHTGINFEQAHFAMQMGLAFDLKQVHKGPYCAWAWFPLTDGTVSGFRKLDIKSPHEIIWKIKLGETYQKAESLIDYGGGIIFWNDDYKILRQDFDYLAQLKQSPIVTKINDYANHAI